MTAIKALALVLATIPIAVVNGIVISILWGWFIVPLGMPSLSVVNAVGMGLVISMFTARPTKSTSDEDIFAAFLFGLFYPLLMLGLGFLWHLFQ